MDFFFCAKKTFGGHLDEHNNIGAKQAKENGTIALRRMDAHYQNRTDDLVMALTVLVTRSTTEPSGLVVGTDSSCLVYTALSLEPVSALGFCLGKTPGTRRRRIIDRLDREVKAVAVEHAVF
jgi:hypothetical protein